MKKISIIFSLFCMSGMLVAADGNKKQRQQQAGAPVSRPAEVTDDTQSTQYSDAHVVPGSQFSRSDVGDGLRPDVEHYESDVHSEEEDLHPASRLERRHPVSSVHSGIGGASAGRLPRPTIEQMRARVTVVVGKQPGEVDPRDLSDLKLKK